MWYYPSCTAALSCQNIKITPKASSQGGVFVYCIFCYFVLSTSVTTAGVACCLFSMYVVRFSLASHFFFASANTDSAICTNCFSVNRILTTLGRYAYIFATTSDSLIIPVPAPHSPSASVTNLIAICFKILVCPVLIK